MQKMTHGLMLLALLSMGVAVGVAVGKRVESGQPAEAQPRVELPAELARMQEAFNKAAETATRAVVHITTKIGSNPSNPRFMPSSSVGSGVIIDKAGLIVTNHHVVDNAKQLWVRMADGTELAAKIVGQDPESDLALIAVEAGRDLPILEWGDSDAARVGDWVLAIGSPYGYNHTVTQGIVSAKHRVTELGKPYEDFLQTDASINPGNSGGALVNLRGELVGINAAIVSQSRGSEGIGLAISAKLARSIVERLKRDGRVRRGFLGITPAELSQTLVDKLSNDGIRTVQDLLDEVGLEKPRGIWVEEVQPGSPAAKAGIRRRDVVVEFNGAKVAGKSHLFFLVADTPPGQKVTLKYLRDRKENEVAVELAERSPVPLK